MLSLRTSLALAGIFLLAVATAASVRVEDDGEYESETGSELPGAWPDQAGLRQTDDVRGAEKKAAGMNQHLTAFEGNQDDDDESRASENDDDEEENQDLDELVNDNAEDPLFEDGEEEEAESFAGPHGPIAAEEEEEVSHAHKDADEDRFESDTVDALYPNSASEPNLWEDSESDKIQDETTDKDWADFGEDNNNDNDMLGEVGDSLSDKNNMDTFDEENQRDNDQMFGGRFSPKIEKR